MSELEIGKLDTEAKALLFEKILADAAFASKKSEAPTDYSSQVERLLEIYRSLDDPRDYKVGDIVVWKNGLRNRRMPHYGQPAVVLEILASPVFDEGEALSSPYYQEPLDVKLGFLDSDEDFVSFLFDGRKFELITI